MSKLNESKNWPESCKDVFDKSKTEDVASEEVKTKLETAAPTCLPYLTNNFSISIPPESYLNGETDVVSFNMTAASNFITRAQSNFSRPIQNQPSGRDTNLSGGSSNFNTLMSLGIASMAAFGLYAGLKKGA